MRYSRPQPNGRSVGGGEGPFDGRLDAPGDVHRGFEVPDLVGQFLGRGGSPDRHGPGVGSGGGKGAEADAYPHVELFDDGHEFADEAVPAHIRFRTG